MLQLDSTLWRAEFKWRQIFREVFRLTGWGWHRARRTEPGRTRENRGPSSRMERVSVRYGGRQGILKMSCFQITLQSTTTRSDLIYRNRFRLPVRGRAAAAGARRQAPGQLWRELFLDWAAFIALWFYWVAILTWEEDRGTQRAQAPLRSLEVRSLSRSARSLARSRSTWFSACAWHCGRQSACVASPRLASHGATGRSNLGLPALQRRLLPFTRSACLCLPACLPAFPLHHFVWFCIPR